MDFVGQNHQPSGDDEALIIDLQQIRQSLQRKFRMILASSLVLLSATALYVYIAPGLRDRYQSEAKLLYNPTQLASVVSNVETGSAFLKSDRFDSNVFENQEEIFASRLLTKRVVEDLKKQGVHLGSNVSLMDLGKKYLQASHIRNTDFIRLVATAGEPKLALKIIESYLKNYFTLMEELTNAPLQEQQKLYTRQLAQAEADLTKLDAELRKYQQTYGIVDIDAESQSKVNERETLSLQVKSLQASLAEKQAEAKRIRKQLKLDDGQNTSAAILSVANGQNSLLQNLHTQLQAAEKDYLTKAKLFAPTNPDMVEIHRQIDVLKSQIADQQIMTVGQKLPDNLMRIHDDVRSNMVAQLASSEVQAAALQRKLAILQGQVGSLKVELKDMPAHQIEYARLQMEKDSKEKVVTRLREKLAEVKIQQAAIGQKLQIIDPPSQPKSPIFPSRLHIVLLAGLAGAVLSSVAVISRDVFAPRQVSPSFMESIARIPVLSMIPWVSDSVWKQCRSRNVLEVLMRPADTTVLKAYQDLALNLKAYRDQSGKNALTVASAYKNSEQSVLIGNLAYCLAQSGERVVVVDTNFRSPSLHSAFGHNLNYEQGLTELINSLSEILYHKPQATTEDLAPTVEASLLASDIHPQLHYINAGISLENTFEFLNSKALAYLVNVLKFHYDWVLFDAPPFLTSPDAAVELRYLDGLLLLLEKDATEGQVQLVAKKVRQLNSNIVGCTLRVIGK